MKKFFKEFAKFISRGNVLDLAVGVIIASAFNKIVSSLVNDLIMPLITWAMGANSLSDLSLVLRESGGTKLTWNYGNFLQVVIDFFIIAFSIFVMLKIVNRSRKEFEKVTELMIKQSKKEYKQERKQIKMQAKENKVPFKQEWKKHLDEKQKLAEQAKKEKEEQERLKAEEYAKLHPSQEELLIQIRDLLQNQTTKKDN